MQTKQKVFVGLSGGVDSSVTAALLKKQGFDVTGVYIQGWYPDWKECNWKENRRDAMRVAAVLDIPFKTLDMSEEYKKDVVDYFLSEYRSGRTPNPDIMCNKHIKFGGFYEWALSQGADFVATGHYARIEKDEDGFSLMRGVDTSKDQSYFLWTLKKEQLAHILFPLGNLEKKKVRTLAKRFKLPTFSKKDSQGICFLEDVSMEEFLKHYFGVHEGKVLSESGAEIGIHDGAVLYTLGQRHGFKTVKESTDEKPYFVVSKDIEKNTITVGHTHKKAQPENIHTLSDTNWLIDPEGNMLYQAQIRHRQTPIPCKLLEQDNDWSLVFEEESETPAPGQSAVVYKDSQVIGGGII